MGHKRSSLVYSCCSQHRDATIRCVHIGECDAHAQGHYLAAKNVVWPEVIEVAMPCVHNRVADQATFLLPPEPRASEVEADNFDDSCRPRLDM